MNKGTLNGILEHIRQELILTEVEAVEISSHYEVYCREMESMKVDALIKYIERQIRSAAFNRGFTNLFEDRKKARDSLIVAGIGFVLGGLFTGNKHEAMMAGMSGFNGMVQGFGESNWYVLLGKKISVLPEETIPPYGLWITLNSFYTVMAELKKRALVGSSLGSLDDIISELKKKP